MGVWKYDIHFFGFFAWTAICPVSSDLIIYNRNEADRAQKF